MRTFLRVTPFVVSVALLSAACGRSGGEASPSSESKSSGTETYALSDVSACAQLVKSMEECGEKESLVKAKREGIQSDIDKGLSKDVVNRKCEIGLKAHRCSNKRNGSDSPPEDKKASAPSSPSTGGRLGIAECDAYLKKLEECGEEPSFVGMSRKGFQIKLDEGKSRADIAKSCGTLLRVYKCKNKR